MKKKKSIFTQTTNNPSIYHAFNNIKRTQREKEWERVKKRKNKKQKYKAKENLEK